MTLKFKDMLKTGMEIVSESWHLYKQNWRQYIPYMGILFVPTLILSVLGTVSTYLEVYLPNSSSISNILILIVFAAGIVVTLWAGIALVKAIANSLSGQTTILWKDNFSSSNHLIWPAFYTSLLTGLIVFLGVLLLIIPGIIFAVWYNFSYYAVILDNTRGMAALKASKAMVQGQWWSILWRLFITALIFGLLGLAVGMVLTIMASLLPLASFLKSVISSLLTSLAATALTPLSVAASVILYYNAKQNPSPTPPQVK